MRKAQIYGQNLVELALLLAIISAAIAGMSIYIKRGFQAKYKAGVDYSIKDILKKDIPRQYEPYYKESQMTESRRGTITRGFPDSSVDMTTETSGWQKVGSAADAD